MSDKPILGFCRPDEETLEVHLGGEVLGTVTHDSVGWSGMESVETLLTRFATALGVEVQEIDPPGEDE